MTIGQIFIIVQFLLLIHLTIGLICTGHLKHPVGAVPNGQQLLNMHVTTNVEIPAQSAVKCVGRLTRAEE